MELSIIQQMIYEIRGQKVMLDFDLAKLYEVPTKVLNQVEKEYQTLSRGFHVQVNERRIQFSKVTNCDLRRQRQL
jgi:hypothetical protein